MASLLFCAAASLQSFLSNIEECGALCLASCGAPSRVLSGNSASFLSLSPSKTDTSDGLSRPRCAKWCSEVKYNMTVRNVRFQFLTRRNDQRSLMSRNRRTGAALTSRSLTVLLTVVHRGRLDIKLTADQNSHHRERHRH